MSMAEEFQGVFTALITPFKTGEVDYTSLKKLIRQQLDAGIQGFVVNGTTAESPTLTEAERWELLSFVQIEVARAVPILMGTGTFSTAATIEQTQKAEMKGAAGALVVVPYYNKPPQAGLVAHFSAVAKSTELPIVLYNVPGRTVAGLSVESIQTLSKIKNIVGIKEATGDLNFGKEIISKVRGDFSVLSGDDFTFLDLAYLGGCGVISVLSHILPAECRLLLIEARSDKATTTQFQKYKAITELLFMEANPIPVKTMLSMMGIISSDELRLPLVPASEGLQGRIRQELQVLGLL